jgi:hypothetical protein
LSPEDPKAHKCHEDHMKAITYFVPVSYDYIWCGFGNKLFVFVFVQSSSNVSLQMSHKQA